MVLRRSRLGIPGLRAAIADVADEEDVAFLDVSSFVTDEDIGTDGVHPIDGGHARIADRIARGLRQLYDVKLSPEWSDGQPEQKDAAGLSGKNASLAQGDRARLCSHGALSMADGCP